jgi:ferrous iron transport protein A
MTEINPIFTPVFYNENYSHLETGMDLSQLRKGQQGSVLAVRFLKSGDVIAQRLLDLGFVQGEMVRCVAMAPVGGDPMLVQIGHTRFALRGSEAARVEIEVAE